MAVLKKYNFLAEEIGKKTVAENFLKVSGSDTMIKNYIVALCKNARQYSANTKDKSEVSGTGKKPHRQKGTGRARQGSFRSPQYRGGGVVFGPKAKDVTVKINKKEKKKVLNVLVCEKIKEKKLLILEDEMKEPKTKTFFEFLKKMKMENKRVLIVGKLDANFKNIMKSISNIPKKHFAVVSNLNGYQLALSEEIIFVNDALDGFLEEVKESA